jgi:hypothetical protein
MQEPNVTTMFRHPDWEVTFVIWAFRKVTKVEAAKAVQLYLKKNQDKPLMRGSRVAIISNYR